MQDLQIEFKENLSGFHPDALKIAINNEETQNHPIAVSAMVKDKDTMYQIQLRSEFPGAFFRDTTMLDDNLVIAIENQLYIVNLISQETKQFRLKGYFDHFQFENDRLFVLTNTHISCFSRQLNELWISEKLGVEKVNIKRIEGEFIIGTGLWKDNKGIVTFKISLNDGTCSNLNPKSKKKRFLASFFASF